MFYNSSPILTMVYAYLTLGLCSLIPPLMSEDLPNSKSILIPTEYPAQTNSNLITNNPFVPKFSGPNSQKIPPPGPQSSTSKSKVLQKYLQFKSIAIIDKKKYFSIFNSRNNKSFWISEGETIENFRVTYYNPTSKTISITDGINSEIIPIITADEAPLNVVSTSAQSEKEVKAPQIPGANGEQNKDKNTTTPRRKVIPVKR